MIALCISAVSILRTTGPHAVQHVRRDARRWHHQACGDRCQDVLCGVTLRSELAFVPFIVPPREEN